MICHEIQRIVKRPELSRKLPRSGVWCAARPMRQRNDLRQTWVWLAARTNNTAHERPIIRIRPAIIPLPLESRVRCMPRQVVIIPRVVISRGSSAIRYRTNNGSLSATLAVIGKCSLILISGAAVRIGKKGLRYSEGASGFKSHISTWEAPPQRKNKIVDLAGLERIETASDAPNDCEAPKR